MSDQVYIDTAVWSKKRWFVRGHPDISFSTEEDATNALKLSGELELKAVNELADKIRDVLP